MNLSHEPEANNNRELLRSINQSCVCMTLDSQLMAARLSADSGVEDLQSILAARPVMFAHTPVFASADDIDAMLKGISAIETVMTNPAYQRLIAERSGIDLSRVQAKTPGIMMAYDFHLGTHGPTLIEINTNAGGAFITHQMQRAMGLLRPTGNDRIFGDAEQQANFLLQMIHQEWQSAGRTSSPATLAIIDDSPTEQFLYPDMLLAQRLLSDHGIDTHIVDASQLHYDGNHLWFGDRKIDFAYNRLTDFQLTDPANAALHDASRDNAVVISPSPTHHALYADKRNLALLTDIDRLHDWGVPEKQIAALSVVPDSCKLDESNAAMLWQQRKKYFFKPFSGFGSKAVYRGDKLTRRVWERIVGEGYIAQKLARPQLRAVIPDAGNGSDVVEQKYDVRVFSYAGQAGLIVARLYQGQTTNFRTPGGGFAPVIVIGAEAEQCLAACS